MCHENRMRSSDDTTKAKNGRHVAQDPFHEFGAAFKEKFSVHFGDEGGRPQRSRLIDVTLPNGRAFSISLGQVVFAALMIWWLPFNWVLLAGLLWLAVQVGGCSTARTGSTDEAPAKAKRKTDAPDGEFEIYRV